MKMKKALCLTLSALMCLSVASMLVACGEAPLDVSYPETEALTKKPVKVWNQNTPAKWNIECSHDPVIVEDNGMFYSFGTDNYGPFGYQIRKSQDMINWEYIGVAIPNFGQGASVLENGANGVSPLQEVYDIMAQDSKFNCETLWAPEVYPAADGGWWLYGCWTTTFGSYRSIIFQCHADNVAGPYEYVDTIVYSGGKGGSYVNAIDASIFEDANGGLWMSYGSFSKGLCVIELDKNTGLRKDGYTFDMYDAGTVTTAQYFGKHIVSLSDGSSPNAEGSVIAYHEVPVYQGDIANEAYDESKWTNKGSYYLVASTESLSKNYNMHCWKSDSPDSGYTSINEVHGNQISGSFSWRTDKNDQGIAFDFYCPGHSDMLTTSAGVNVMAYHNRSEFSGQQHYLFVSMYDFNSNGDLVLSPNRYVGESVRTIDKREIYTTSGGSFDMVKIPYTNLKAWTTEQNIYCTEGVKFNKDGTISGAATGTWKLYGDHYIYMVVDGEPYYGSVMPAYIEKAKRGGLTISAIGQTTGAPIYFNMHFDVAEG